MKRFKYKKATTIATAVSALKSGNAAVLAGGTDILNLLKIGALTTPPETLVNIKNIRGLDAISENGKGLTIGALARLSDISNSEIVKQKYPALARAAESVSSPPLREMGTIAGNICQEAQCWYFRRSFLTGTFFDCFRKGGHTCFAITAENRYHSIYGGIRVNSTPCSTYCPTGTDIPSYMCMIREGDLAGASKILLECNPLPAVTGRVCLHFCESECNRANTDEAVSVRTIERFIGDYILDNSAKLVKFPKSGKKKVAVIGSGPAGLTAAYYLRKLGHAVTIFEALPVAGGMLAAGIPSYRLPADVLNKTINFIKGTGVEIKTNSPIGKDLSIGKLRKQGYDAVFVATGAMKGRKLPIPGADLEGTLVNMDFLRDVKMGKKVKLGQRVLVLGGGNVAFDCARTAIRLGAKEVHMACLESREKMPADPAEIKEGEEEGIIIHPGLTFTKVVGAKGKVTGVECLNVLWMRFDENGRLEMETIPGTEHVIPADTVIFSIGQAPDLGAVAGSEVKTTKRGFVSSDPETLETDMAGVFAGGDAVVMAGKVSEAIAAGKKAASSIDKYLGGKGIEPAAGESKSFTKFNNSNLEKTSRINPTELPVSKRIKSTDMEIVGGLNLSAIEAEANRCLNCGCVAINSSDIAPVLIALNAKIKTTKKVIDAEQLFTVEANKTTVLDKDEIITEIQIPAPKPGTRQTFTKFALRPTIDFAVVNVATAITTKAGKITDARIVLNAVAPVPYRATEAEEVLRGKAITEKLAEQAADASVKDTIHLNDNKYKVQIARTLVKRAILA